MDADGVDLRPAKLRTEGSRHGSLGGCRFTYTDRVPTRAASDHAGHHFAWRKIETLRRIEHCHLTRLLYEKLGFRLAGAQVNYGLK